MAEGQGSAALSGAVYKPARSALSTVVVNKSSHRAVESRRAKKSRFLGTWRRTLSTFLRRSGIHRYLNRWVPVGGCRRRGYRGDRRSFQTGRLDSLPTLNTEEICSTIKVRDFGQVLGLLTNIDTEHRAPESALRKGECGLKDGRGSRRRSKDFGGTVV